MWCSRCQQDVPGIANERRICCARCGEKLSSGYAATTNSAASPQSGGSDSAAIRREPGSATTTALADPPPVDLDNWELDEELRSAARMVRALRSTGTLQREESPASAAPSSSLSRQIDSAHAAAPDWHAGGKLRRTSEPERPRRRGASFFSWLTLSLGLMTFVCGAVLVGWSFASGRGELWSLGLPLVLIGQAALIVGLVFQLDGLWQNNRETSKTLDELDDQLHDLRHATTMLGSTHGSASRSFYAHLADGAGPQLLLADLKGQMDVLSLRLAQERRSR